MNDELELEPNLEDAGDAVRDATKIKALREEITVLKKERQEYLDGWQRCKAEAVNTGREQRERAARTAEVLREELIHDLLPALDSFDMASQTESWESVSDGFKTGMEMVRDQLLAALKKHGIERYGRVGEKVDHARHEVLEERDASAGESGTVVRIIRFGYATSDRVLRPAHVISKR